MVLPPLDWPTIIPLFGSCSQVLIEQGNEANGSAKEAKKLCDKRCTRRCKEPPRRIANLPPLGLPGLSSHHGNRI